MTEKVCSNEYFSTTKLLRKEKPTIKNYPEDKLHSVLFLSEYVDRQNEGGLRTKGYFKKSYENKPLISIVTVVYNGKKYLKQTIKSVINQTYDNVEYIIVDGGSTDGTLDIVKKYEEQIDYWVSEPDGGIYDAMNKGIRLSTGKYIAFMNADDWFLDGVLKLVADSSLEEKPDYIFGNLNRLDDNGNIEVHKGDIEKFKIHTPIGHQALFVKNKILTKMPFDTQYGIMADYDLMIKLIKLNFSYIYIDKPLANFRLGGISSVNHYRDRDRFDIQYKNFGISHAIFGFIRGTKRPMIYNIVRPFIKAKHRIFKGK